MGFLSQYKNRYSNCSSYIQGESHEVLYCHTRRISGKEDVPMRILIAEDSATCRMILSGALTDTGYDVIETVDGAEAWNVMQKPDAPLLAILDWIMPNMDGLTLLRKIRARKTERPPYIIMLTGRGEKNDIIEGLETGANDYLPKPFDPKELRARVSVGRRMIELQEALIESREKLAFQATHDPLTGLLNRRAVFDSLNKSFSKLHGQKKLLTVAMCDIDHFKKVNDTYGHQTGDEILSGLAKLLNSCTRKIDSVGRIGGEEFLMVTLSQTKQAALERFENCRKKIAEAQIKTRSGALSITMSFGVAFSADSRSVDEMVSAADKALYRAKRDGRNKVCHQILS